MVANTGTAQPYLHDGSNPTCSLPKGRCNALSGVVAVELDQTLASHNGMNDPMLVSIRGSAYRPRMVFDLMADHIIVRLSADPALGTPVSVLSYLLPPDEAKVYLASQRQRSTYASHRRYLYSFSTLLQRLSFLPHPPSLSTSLAIRHNGR